MSIRVRLILSYMTIVLVILLATSAYLNRSLTQMFNEQITSELKVQATLIREFLITPLPRTFNYDTIDTLVDELAATSSARLTFIGPDGTVWGTPNVMETL